MRRVRILADLEAWRLRSYVKRAAEFLAGAKILLPSTGGRGDLPVLGGQLVGTRPTTRGVPSSLGVLMRRDWHDAGVRTSPATLTDQRVAEILSLQELLTDWRSSEAAHDGWVWNGPRFTARVLY